MGTAAIIRHAALLGTKRSPTVRSKYVLPFTLLLGGAPFLLMSVHTGACHIAVRMRATFLLRFRLPSCCSGGCCLFLLFGQYMALVLRLVHVLPVSIPLGQITPIFTRLIMTLTPLLLRYYCAAPPSLRLKQLLLVLCDTYRAAPLHYTQG